MSKEKAIYVLEMNNPFMGGEKQHDLSEAMDMAIKAIKDKRCESAIPIPNGATNGDMIKVMLQIKDEDIKAKNSCVTNQVIEYVIDTDNYLLRFDNIFWNAPYNPPKQNLAPADKSGLEYADQPTLQSAT